MTIEALEADRGRDGQVDDRAQAEADAGQDEEGIDEEQADAAGHGAKTVDHRVCMVAETADDTGSAGPAGEGLGATGIDTGAGAPYRR